MRIAILTAYNRLYISVPYMEVSKIVIFFIKNSHFNLIYTKNEI